MRLARPVRAIALVMFVVILPVLNLACGRGSGAARAEGAGEGASRSPFPVVVSTPTTRPVAVLPTSTPAPASTDAVVEIVDAAFWPDRQTVMAGGRVTWRHIGAANHDAVSIDRLWHSGTLTAGFSFMLALAQPGEFRYFCSFHPEMTGVIVVEP